jgi:hypothetical protein
MPLHPWVLLNFSIQASHFCAISTCRSDKSLILDSGDVLIVLCEGVSYHLIVVMQAAQAIHSQTSLWNLLSMMGCLFGFEPTMSIFNCLQFSIFWRKMYNRQWLFWGNQKKGEGQNKENGRIVKVFLQGGAIERQLISQRSMENLAL